MCSDSVAPGPWQKVSLEFTAASWAPLLNIAFVVEGGKAYLDDFELVKVDLPQRRQGADVVNHDDDLGAVVRDLADESFLSIPGKSCGPTSIGSAGVVPLPWATFQVGCCELLDRGDQPGK